MKEKKGKEAFFLKSRSLFLQLCFFFASDGGLGEREGRSRGSVRVQVLGMIHQGDRIQLRIFVGGLE